MIDTTSNELFPQFFETPILFIDLRKKRNIGIFSIDRIDFPKDLREKTNAMIKELVKLFFEEFFPKSLFWQRSNERWKNRTRKWGKDFRDCAKLYLEGLSSTLVLPPIYKKAGIYLAVGTYTVFRMEKELIREFIREALPVINRCACEFGFTVVSSYHSRNKVAELWGVDANDRAKFKQRSVG
jgi:hypothetical protein